MFSVQTFILVDNVKRELFLKSYCDQSVVLIPLLKQNNVQITLYVVSEIYVREERINELCFVFLCFGLMRFKV